MNQYLLAGLTGNVEYDSNGDRQPDYWLWNIGTHSDRYTLVAEIRVNETPELVSIMHQTSLSHFFQSEPAPRIRAY